MGKIIKKLGFIKERVGKERQHIVHWDEERVKKLASPYGLELQPSLFPPEVVKVSLVSTPDTKQADTIDLDLAECPPKCPPNSEASPSVTADTKDRADGFLSIRGSK